MDRLGVIPTSSAIALHCCDGCLINSTNYLPEALPMRTSGLFIGKRPLYLRICPLFLGKRPLFLRKYLLLLRTCPLFLGKRALFFGKRPLYLLKYRTLRERFLRQSRLCMEGDNNCVISCKLRQSFALSRARVRAYRQEFNDFCCHICHMYILNH